MNRGAWLLQNASLCVTDPRHSEELDQAVVCAEAGRAAHLQDPQKWPVGWNGAAQCLRAHREALQEGRLLLQALPPAGAVHLGRQGQSPPTLAHQGVADICLCCGSGNGVQCDLFLFHISSIPM